MWDSCRERRLIASVISTQRSWVTMSYRRSGLPGSGGACEIAILARKVLVIAPQSKRCFLKEWISSRHPDFVDGPDTRAQARYARERSQDGDHQFRMLRVHKWPVE